MDPIPLYHRERTGNNTRRFCHPEALQDASTCRISAVTYVESAIVTDSNRNPVLSRRFDDLLPRHGEAVD